MPEPPHHPEQGPDGREDPTERLLDEAFRLGDDGGEWVELAQRATRPAEPLGALGPYILLEEIGRGGQGEVYKALQPGTGRTIALKRLAVGGLRIGSRAAERFSREVEAVTRLAHANVVTVYAADVIDGHAVLAMEWIDGPTIDRWADAVWTDPTMAEGEKLRRTLAAFLSACEGVSHAHQRGVIHRDLKPTNIMIGRDGTPRVVDFGVAKVLEEWRANPPPGIEATAWTATGFAGTPAYAPPEQLGNTIPAVDTRTDVYALGVILFRLVSGEEAFEANRGLAELLDSVRRGPAQRPSQLRPAIGREIDWIVLKAMDADPARRYQTVDALADDVRRLLDGRAVLAHPPSAVYNAWRAVRRRPRTSLLVAMSASAVISLGSIALVQAVRLSARSRDLAAALATAEAEATRAARGEERQLMLSRRLLKSLMAASSDDAFAYSTDAGSIGTLTTLVEQLTPDDDEPVAVDLRMRLGFALRDARRYAEAEPQFALAQEISDRIDEPSSERATRIAMRRTEALRATGRHAEALACIDLAIERAASGSPTIYSAVLHLERMHCLNGMKRPIEEVFACASTFIAACDAHPTRKSERARAREESAGIATIRGQIAQAEAWIREALDIASTGGVDAASVSRFQFRLASAVAAQDRWKEAEPAARAAADYRLGRESANGSRASTYLRFHAEVLHRLGRFDEAAARWELALIRPLGAAKPSQEVIVPLRLRLASARFAIGQRSAALTTLALAVSRGRTPDVEDATIRDKLLGIEVALREGNWQIDDALKARLGELGWLVDGSPEPEPTPVPQEE